MNVQEYISSGIVESYVLGLATPEEQREFEQNCAKYPEVLQARIAFEIAWEQQAMQNAIAPPADLRQSILAAVKDEDGLAPVVTMTGSAPVVKSNWFKYAAVAASVLLAASIFWNISLNNRIKKAESDFAAVQNRYDSTVAKKVEADKEKEIIMGERAASMKMAKMEGLPAAPAAYATVYWDSTSKNVYLMVNNLPTPASDKQYQLWALLDGKPIDLGLIPQDYFVGQKQLLLTMKNTVGAQAFAITLEKKGGSSNPAAPEGVMYTLGKL